MKQHGYCYWETNIHRSLPIGHHLPGFKLGIDANTKAKLDNEKKQKRSSFLAKYNILETQQQQKTNKHTNKAESYFMMSTWR